MVLFVGGLKIRKVVHGYRDVQRRILCQGLRQVSTVLQQGSVLLPAVESRQVQGVVVRVLFTVGAAKAPGVGTGVQGRLRRRAVHGHRGPDPCQGVESPGKWVEGRDGDVLGPGVGEDIAVRHLCPPLTGLSVSICPGGEIPGESTLRREAGAGLQRGQGERRPGIGHEHRTLAVAAAAAAAPRGRAVRAAAESAVHGAAGAEPESQAADQDQARRQPQRSPRSGPQLPSGG